MSQCGPLFTDVSLLLFCPILRQIKNHILTRIKLKKQPRFLHGIFYVLHQIIILGQLTAVAGTDSIGHGGTCPTFTNRWALRDCAFVVGSTVWSVSCLLFSYSRRDQTVLPITKALIKTTNCTCRAKKWRGTTK